MTSARFPFQPGTGGHGESVLMPVLPLILRMETRQVETHALVDSGSALNVMPWTVGLRLGASWDHLDTSVKLTGSLGAAEAKALIVEGVIAGLSAVRLVFAWTKSDAVPILLGQVNFFMEFDVCFFRKSGVFDVSVAK
jgi:hypothetical protein